MLNDFKGAARARSEVKMPVLAHRLNVDEDTIRAVMEVEAGGSGFDSQGRPKMLFEPHIFYRLLSGTQRERAVESGLAYPRWGERPYPRESYTRLRQAMEINPEVALQSASWGAGQILGTNHAIVGYGTAEAMVRSFMESEDPHIEAMVRFILAAGLDADLRARNWRAFARGYNGPGFERNDYHNKLARAYARWAGIPDVDWQPDSPDPQDAGFSGREEVARLQARLAELLYPEVGRADGVWGPRTRAALLAFRADHGLPIVAAMDETVWAALARSTGRPGAHVRQNETLDDLRAEGSETIREADQVQTVGRGVLVGGGGLAVLELLKAGEDYIGPVRGLLDAVQPVVSILSQNLWLVGLAVGFYLIREAGVFQRLRLRDHQSLKNVGR